MQPPQSRLKAVILKTAKANGFQAPLFESTQTYQAQQARGLSSLSPNQAHSELESSSASKPSYPYNSAAFSHPYTSSQASSTQAKPSNVAQSFSERPSSLINSQAPKVYFSNPEALTDSLCKSLEADLSKKELKTFKLLHTVALEVAAARRYSPNVTHVTFFCPAEIIALALEISRTTLWRQLKIMEELGIISHSPHKTTYRSKTRNDGSVWNIKLNPSKGKAARLSYDELKTQYRNLESDVKNKRTAYAALSARKQQQEEAKQANEQDLKQDKKQNKKQEADSPHKDYEYTEEFPLLSKMKQSYTTTENYHGKILILNWSLKPLLSISPVSNDCFIPEAQALNQTGNQASFYLESMLDIKFTNRDDRNDAIHHAASSICIALNDAKSHKFYCDLLWNLLRRYDRGEDEFLKVFEMILRAKTDHLEGFARSAGALFVSRLKKWQVYEEIKRTPASRVGVKPGLAA